MTTSVSEGYLDEIIPVSEAVKFLTPKLPGVDITHLLSDVRRGRNRNCKYIPYERVGLRVYYRRRDLLILADSRKSHVGRAGVVKKFEFDEVPSVRVDSTSAGVEKVVITHNADSVTLRAKDAFDFACDLKRRSRSALLKGCWHKLVRS